MEFKTPTISDVKKLNEYFQYQKFTACGYSAAMITMWAPFYDIQYAVVEDMLVIVSKRQPLSFSFPVGKGNPKKAIDTMMVYCREKQIEFRMHGITKEFEQQLRQMYGDIFEFEYDRDEAEYVYLTEKLIHLTGKKYHGKRNHINRFNENHEWTYEPITDENALECIVMLMEWKIESDDKENIDKKHEITVAKDALLYYKELGLNGGLIRSEGKVIAFALGEKVNDDMFVVHFEKAFADIQGAYPIINQQFAKNVASNYLYLNREEDCGDEGLRKAKLSYRPEFMVEKAFVTLKA